MTMTVTVIDPEHVEIEIQEGIHIVKYFITNLELNLKITTLAPQALIADQGGYGDVFVKPRYLE